MLEIAIRRAAAEDASLITDLIKKMIVDMESYGGYPVNTSPGVWDSLESNVRANCLRQEYMYLIAEHPLHHAEVYGMAAANLESLEDIFISQKRLHISALYTTPTARRQGVARQMLQRLFQWGQQLNVKEIDLNVLVANPARNLYEQFGFKPREISMVSVL